MDWEQVDPFDPGWPEDLAGPEYHMWIEELEPGVWHDPYRAWPDQWPPEEAA